MRKLLIFCIIFLCFVLLLFLFFPDLLGYMTLESIKGSHEKWVALYNASPAKIVSYFIIFNIVMAMLPIPGISMISLLGGSLFGFFPGLIFSSIATAIGNLGGFLLSRYFLQDWVKTRYGDHLIVFRSEWQAQGSLALFSFRLFPFIPSFVANFVMGVSSLKWWTFFWVSWIGRIPMVIVYTWSGVQIAKINTLEDVLDVKIVISFILLGLLPWCLKFILKKIKREKI
jgi:uncharacterized membrane protein YdjX (TVP38/TMEM64 family)